MEVPVVIIMQSGQLGRSVEQWRKGAHKKSLNGAVSPFISKAAPQEWYGREGGCCTMVRGKFYRNIPKYSFFVHT